MAAGPAGYFSYQAASSYNRLGAAEDTLQFMPQNSLGARYAVWFPGRNATTTMSNAALISWSSTSTNCVLNFPGPGGTAAQITAALPPASALFPPYILPLSDIQGSSMQAAYPPSNAVDANYNDFWVSSGTSAGQGPTPAHPEWLLVTFQRQVALSEFQVFPRTLNGGYGPKAVQMLLNVTDSTFTNSLPAAGTNVYQGTMLGTATLDVLVSPPVYATNAMLWITSSYDPSFPSNSRNVQVVELNFLERAAPGTYGDWAVRQFTDAQLSDPAIGAADADPDSDGVRNLAEFAMGGNPLVADGAAMSLQPVSSSAGTFAFSFRERKDLGDVARHFESSTNLVDWSEVSPSSLSILASSSQTYMRAAVFPLLSGGAYFRLRYSEPSNP